MSRYQIQPMAMPQRGPSIWDLGKKYAMDKGAQMALSGMGGPQGAVAGEMFNALRPALGFNKGGRVGADTYGAPAVYKNMGGPTHTMPDGRVMAGRTHADTYGAPAVYKNLGGPLGGGQTKEGLKEARRLGALTQAEYLKAMAHAGYKNSGGKVHMGPLASMKYKHMADGGEVHEYEKKYHNPLAGGLSSKEK